MFVSIFNYIYTQSPCKLRYLSYRGTSFCMLSSKKFAAKPAFLGILQNMVCVLITPQSVACQKFLDVEKQVIITSCAVGTVHSMLENVALEFFK